MAESQPGSHGAYACGDEDYSRRDSPVPNIPISATLGETKALICKCYFKWIIHDFSAQPPSNFGPMTSPEFSSDDNGMSFVAKMLINSNNTDEMNGDVLLGVCLKRQNTIRPCKTAIYKYRIPAKTDEKSMTGNQYCSYESSGIKWGNIRTSRNLLNEENGFLTDDKLTIYFELLAFGVPVIVKRKMELPRSVAPKEIKVPECRICEKLGDLLESTEFSDVTLAVGDRELRAHKAILAANSAVFSAMFRSDMTENKDNRVDIKDVDAEVLREMLRFVYTGETTKLHEMGLDLLAVADKYDLVRLKSMCEATICNDIGVEHAANIWLSADLHRAEQLRRKAVEFVVNNLVEVQKTEGYKTIVKTHPKLIDGLLSHCVAKIKMNE